MTDSSHYERLSIYKGAMDLVVKLDSIVRDFSRYHKYSIGTQIRDKALNLIDLIVQANTKEMRGQKLPQLCAQVESMKVLCNVGQEVKAWKSFKQYMQVMEQVMNVARQAQGWRKDFESKRPDLSTSHAKV